MLIAAARQGPDRLTDMIMGRCWCHCYKYHSMPQRLSWTDLAFWMWAVN